MIQNKLMLEKTISVSVVALGLLMSSYSFAETEMTLNEVKQGTLLMQGEIKNKYFSAPLQETSAKIIVTGPIARTTVTQHFRNPGQQWAEAIYAFPLPEDSAVDHMRMKIGDQIIEGVIKEKAEAKRNYQQAAKEGKRAGLVEQHRPNLFTTSVANIPPNGEIEIVIEYQQLLKWQINKFSLMFPMAITPRFNPGSGGTLLQTQEVGQGWDILPGELNNKVTLTQATSQAKQTMLNPVSLEVVLNAGFPVDRINSRYHAVDQYKQEDGAYLVRLKQEAVPAHKDFLLEWQPKAGKSASAAFFTEHTEKGDFALLMVMPPPSVYEQASNINREVIFIIDTSGSMGGASIHQAREALKLALGRLKPDDRFNVIEFNNDASVFFPQPKLATKDNIEQAIYYASNLTAGGGTNMLPALEAALTMSVDENRFLQQVVFITDGAVSNELELLTLIHNQLGKKRLFTVAIGSAPNHYFMTEAAYLGRGSFTNIAQISEVAEKMNVLFSRLEHPALTDLQLKLPVTADTLPNPLPDLYLGEPVVALMALDAIPDQALLEAYIGDLIWKNELKLKHSQQQNGLGVQWARLRITQMERNLSRGADEKKVREGILNLALQHHLVSRYTSLLAIDVTPVRAIDEALKTTALKNNPPAGLKQLVPMAQGATSYQFLLLIGFCMMLLAAFMFYSHHRSKAI